MTVGSLCAGIDGFGLGFHRAGFEVRWQVEIDPKCRSVLARHFPTVKRFEDIREVGKRNLERVDIITAGTPCQDLSVAGKRGGLKGERSGLFFEFVRIVRELRPAFAVWENVPGAFSSHAGRDFALVLGAFRECGARDIAWRVLDAQYFGLAQRRERVFVVADFGGERAGEILFESRCGCGHPPKGRESGQRVAASLGSRSSRRGVNPPGRGGEDDQNIIFTELGEGHTTYQASEITAPIRTNGGGGGMTANLIAPALARCVTAGEGQRDDGESCTFVAFGFTMHGSDDCRSTATEADTAQTVRCRPPGQIENSSTTVALLPMAFNWQNAGKVGYGMTADGTGPLDTSQTKAVFGGMGVRRLMPIECERLQGFPDGWTAEDADGKPIADGPRYRMLGNAVAVPVAEWIARRMMQEISKPTEGDNRQAA